MWVDICVPPPQSSVQAAPTMPLNLWFFAYCKIRPGVERQTKADGMRRSMSVVRGVTTTSPACAAKAEAAKRLLGREGQDLDVYEIAGSQLKPLCWSEEAVLLDMGYLAEVPEDLSTVLVAERVEQCLQGGPARERRAVAGSIVAGIATGALVCLSRKGQPNTLRRAFTAAMVSSVVLSIPLSSASIITDRMYPLRTVCGLLQNTQPDLLRRFYDFEVGKLHAARRDLDNALMKAQREQSNQPPVLEQLTVQEAEQRTAAFAPFLGASTA